MRQRFEKLEQLQVILFQKEANNLLLKEKMINDALPQSRFLLCSKFRTKNWLLFAVSVVENCFERKNYRALYTANLFITALSTAPLTDRNKQSSIPYICSIKAT